MAIWTVLADRLGIATGLVSDTISYTFQIPSPWLLAPLLSILQVLSFGRRLTVPPDPSTLHHSRIYQHICGRSVVIDHLVVDVSHDDIWMVRLYGST